MDVIGLPKSSINCISVKFRMYSKNYNKKLLLGTKSNPVLTPIMCENLTVLTEPCFGINSWTNSIIQPKIIICFTQPIIRTCKTALLWKGSLSLNNYIIPCIGAGGDKSKILLRNTKELARFSYDGYSASFQKKKKKKLNCLHCHDKLAQLLKVSRSFNRQ